MTGRIVILLATLAAGLVPVARVSANGFRLADQDGLATARGEAFVATADNAAAVYYNPAGITQLTNSTIRSGLYAIRLDPSYRRLNGGETHGIGKNYAAAPNFFATHTLEKLPVSFGVGIYAPYGGSIRWPQTTGFETVATYGSLTYLRLSPVMAVRLTPTLSFAAGAMVDYARINLQQDLLPYPSRFANFFKFSGDGWSAGYTLGLRWQPHEKIAFGATLRSATSVTFEGETDFELQPIRGVSSPVQRDAKATFDFPLTAGFGVSYRPTPKWNFEFNADYTDWSSFDTVNIEMTTPPPPRTPFRAITPVTLNWQASWMYSFGVTRYFDNGWHVSAGYLFNENSVPDDYYTPLAADLDRHCFSLGAGFKARRYNFDVAYQFGYGPARTVTGSTPSSTPAQFAGQSADGVYDFISHAVMLTWGLNF